MGKAKRDQVIGPGPDDVLVAHFEDQARVACQFAKRAKHGVPTDIALARVPVPVGLAIGILQMDMVQHVARSMDEVIHRWPAGRAMGIVGMAGVD